MAWLAYLIRYAAYPLLSRIARSPELLVTYAIAWAALLAAIGSYLGLSKELGGLLAGISLASTPFREAIIARLTSFKRFSSSIFLYCSRITARFKLIRLTNLPCPSFFIICINR